MINARRFDPHRALIMPAMDQLFSLRELRRWRDRPLILIEDLAWLQRYRHHQHKLILALAGQRSYRDELRRRDWCVEHVALEEDRDDHALVRTIARWAEQTGSDHIVVFDTPEQWQRERSQALADAAGLPLVWAPSPGFLTPRDELEEWMRKHDHPLMHNFWKWQRRRMNLLLDGDGQPQGGRWSFDSENRESLPNDVVIPELPELHHSIVVREVQELVADRFSENPGKVRDFWLPTTRHQARRWLKDFCQHRLERFGPYQDALTDRHPTVFHGVLTPLLNFGILTPQEVIEAVERRHAEEPIPLPSLEGFLRQIAGWREFVRGVHQVHGVHQEQSNHYDHYRGLTAAWWTGETGLPPLDDTIRKARRTGYLHHIERLMVVGNLMLLCEIEPDEVHRWFSELHVDSADWVMGPNVFGMALRSDGGLMTTKPYCCGSSYLKRMGHWEAGPWCDIVDGLYWRFIERHRAEFAENPRLAVMIGSLDRMDRSRRARIAEAAEDFLDRMTILKQVA